MAFALSIVTTVGTTCGTVYPEESLEVDDVEVTTDASCPSQ
jgi:hypothetical protein